MAGQGMGGRGMDGIERAGLSAGGQPIPGKADAAKFDLNTPHPNPEIEAVRKQLHADYTRKSTEVANLRRDAETLQQQAQALQQQALAAIQNVNQTAAGIQQTQQQFTPEPVSFADNLEQQFGTELDAQSRSVLNALAEHSASKTEALESQVARLTETVQGLTGEIQSGQASLRAVAQQPELSRLVGVFGQEEIQKRMPQVGELMRNNPSLGIENALAAADPAFFAKAHQDAAVKEQLQKTNQEQQRMFQNLGELANGSEEPGGGQGEGPPPLVPGESFADSVKAEVGDTGFNYMLSQNAIEAAQQ